MKKLGLKIVLAIFLYATVILGTFTSITNPIPAIVMLIFILVLGIIVVLRESN